MKNVAILLAAIVAMSCSKHAPTMPGAYKLVSQTNQFDTSLQTESFDQLKIFTGQCVMYARFSAKDSITAFGFGTYIVDANGVNETILYSATDSLVDSRVVSYSITVEATEKGYKQVLRDVEFRGRRYLLTEEEYERVGTTTPSALDGAWTLTHAFAVTATGDTVRTDNAAQYKVYYAGNFIFGHTTLDTMNVSHAGIGYGTFETTDTGIREHVLTTNYPGAIRSFDLSIVFNGTDEYTQTIAGENGYVVSVETYKRLGK